MEVRIIFLWGGSSSGNRVTERSAMQMTAVYSCVRILSETLASLPLHVYEVPILVQKSNRTYVIYVTSR